MDHPRTSRNGDKVTNIIILTSPSYEDITSQILTKAEFLLKLKPKVTSSSSFPPSRKFSLQSSGSTPRWKITTEELHSWADFFSVWKTQRDQVQQQMKL